MELKDFYYCLIKLGTKHPIEKAWQKNLKTYEEVRESAHGILTGRGGFLAIDCDGGGAIARLQELFGGLIPDTWAWSSGREGRVQFGFFVPEQLRSLLTQARYWENLSDGSQLDFRWRGCQSVLPPSPHPLTGGYQWEQSPADFPLATAPEWLIKYAVSLKHRDDSQPRVRIPARIYSYYGAPLKLWAYLNLMARGSGRAEFCLERAARDLGRSIRTIRRWLAIAFRQKLIRNFYTLGRKCVAYPTAILKVVRETGWSTLGEITEVSLDDFQKLRNLNILCTEAIACGLQAASLYAARKELESHPLEASELLKPNPAEPGKRVLWRGERFLAVSESVATIGVSQGAIGLVRNVCPQTIVRHLGDNYRNTPSPITRQRVGLKAIDKIQVVKRIPRRMNGVVEIALSEELTGDFYLKCGDRYYRCCPNIYQFQRGLCKRVRHHRRAYKLMADPSPHPSDHLPR